MKRLRKDFESDPVLQYKIHMLMTYFWLFNFAVALLVFVAFQGFWQKASVLYLVLVSLYANFATDYGAVSAAEAAHGQVVSGSIAPVVDPDEISASREGAA